MICQFNCEKYCVCNIMMLIELIYINADYSFLLYQVFDFADQYQGSYNSSIPQGACPFYCDFSGYVVCNIVTPKKLILQLSS